jgi:hypothetical protein
MFDMGYARDGGNLGLCYGVIGFNFGGFYELSIEMECAFSIGIKQSRTILKSK